MVYASAFFPTLPEWRPQSLGQCNWSPDALATFTFLMSGHHQPVNAAMMLGDAGYARAQLRMACTFDDVHLQQIAVDMLGAMAHAAEQDEPSPAAVLSSGRWSH